MQHTWLKSMGADQRLKNLLAQTKDKSIREKLVRGHDYMINLDKMGARFKFMCVVSKERATLGIPITGFENPDNFDNLPKNE